MPRKHFKRTFCRSVGNMKKTGFYGYVYDFSVDYYATEVGDILNIYKCLMKKNNIK